MPKVFNEEWVYNPNLEVLWYFDEEGENIYEVDVEPIKGSAGILDWISHILGKVWATPKCLKGLLDAFDFLGNLEANFCGDGIDKPSAMMVAIVRRNEIGWRYFPIPEEKPDPTLAPGEWPKPVDAADLIKAAQGGSDEWVRESEERARRAGLIKGQD